jgi:hypothetical protein
MFMQEAASVGGLFILERVSAAMSAIGTITSMLRDYGSGTSSTGKFFRSDGSETLIPVIPL